MEKNKKKWQTIKTIVLVLITILVIVYVLYVFARASFTQITSISAAQSTVYDTIDVNAYIVRSEQYIEYKDDGVISYTVSNGDKVSKNENVANVFADSNLSSKKQELDELQTKLAALNQLEKSIGTFSKTPDEIDKSISGLLCRSNISIANGDMSLADKNVQDIVYHINERQLVTGKVATYSEKIKEIQDKINDIKKANTSIQKTNSIQAPVSGYFSAETDGFEKSFDIAKISELMPGALDDGKIKRGSVPENAVGKLIDKVYWYVVFEVNADDAIRIKNANYLKVNIPVVSNQNIKVELAALNQPDKSGNALVVLKGTYMNPQMANIRNESISLVMDDFTGIYIPKSAVHEQVLPFTSEDKDGNDVTVEKSVTGVYVRMGNEVTFRQIDPIYAGEDYVIGEVEIEKENLADDTKPLKIYDQIITEGANLYDGKIVQRNS